MLSVNTDRDDAMNVVAAILVDLAKNNAVDGADPSSPGGTEHGEVSGSPFTTPQLAQKSAPRKRKKRIAGGVDFDTGERVVPNPNGDNNGGHVARAALKKSVANRKRSVIDHDEPESSKPTRKPRTRGKGGQQTDKVTREAAVERERGSEEVAAEGESKTFLTRMSPKGFSSLMDRLNEAQLAAITDMGFGCFDKFRLRKMPVELAAWLAGKFNPFSCTLDIDASKRIEVTALDVYITMGIPYGEVPIEEVANETHGDQEYKQLLAELRAAWRMVKGTPKLNNMADIIVGYGDGGVEFRRNFILYMVATFFHGNQQRNCSAIFVKNVVHIDRIKDYDWCTYTIDRLIDATKKRALDPTKCFEGPIIFLIMLYLDRIVIASMPRRGKCPTMGCWTEDSLLARIVEETKWKAFGKGRLEPRLHNAEIEDVIRRKTPRAEDKQGAEGDLQNLQDAFRKYIEARINLTLVFQDFGRKHGGEGGRADEVWSKVDEIVAGLTAEFQIATQQAPPSNHSGPEDDPPAAVDDPKEKSLEFTHREFPVLRNEAFWLRPSVKVVYHEFI